ncbi:cytochrome-c peroxidase [Chitinophaga rhizosphaerae]|uniref:cytochrome-c peroxidase n=1 Tax=Chitinophaga rhizosphaerae TaxID=1864947 RepID=UPI001F0B7597|nr:cytochrome c peroxidase [Chitinophaga rhizosphaerae]
MKKYVVYTCFVMALIWACRKSGDNKPPAGPTPYTISLPAHFPQPVYDLSRNPPTVEGVALGRRLFYDPRLSRDSTISCGFCHQQFAAFAHFDHALSHGIDNRNGFRSVPSLFNLLWQKDFMWDGGVNHLDIQPLTPISDANEMGEDLGRLIARLNADKKYRSMFDGAFGPGEINSQKLFRALSQFMATMNSFNAKYDSVLTHKAQFSPDEQAGYAIFQAKCAACHKEPLFTDGSFRNNGLPYNEFLNDAGRMRITNSTGDYLKFRVPSLRNIIKSPPYMHDGRFYDIYDVFEHYSSGIEQTPTIDPIVKNGIPLSQEEQRQLYFFLTTLTDHSFINNKSLSEILIYN